MVKLGSSGQSLIELIVAIAIGAIVVASLAFATISSLRNATLAQNQSQATKLAQEGIERVRASRDRNLNVDNIGGTALVRWSAPYLWTTQFNLSSGCNEPTTHCYYNLTSTNNLDFLSIAATIPSSAELISNRFQRVVIINDEPSRWTVEKKVTVIVTWTDFSGSHESKLTTALRRI